MDPVKDSDGRIILLNGVSSAGKTSIAKALQAQLDEPYLHVCIDSFEDMMPAQREAEGPFAWRPIFSNMLSGFHHSIRALAECGNNLIVNHVLVEGEEPETWLSECLQLIEPYKVFFVGVHCPIEELDRREISRGDRPKGLARWQFDRMHRQVVYDFEVDTSVCSPQECANLIQAALSASPTTGLSSTLKLH